MFYHKLGISSFPLISGYASLTSAFSKMKGKNLLRTVLCKTSVHFEHFLFFDGRHLVCIADHLCCQAGVDVFTIIGLLKQHWLNFGKLLSRIYCSANHSVQQHFAEISIQKFSAKPICALTNFVYMIAPRLIIPHRSSGQHWTTTLTVCPNVSCSTKEAIGNNSTGNSYTLATKNSVLIFNGNRTRLPWPRLFEQIHCPFSETHAHTYLTHSWKAGIMCKEARVSHPSLRLLGAVQPGHRKTLRPWAGITP